MKDEKENNVIGNSNIIVLKPGDYLGLDSKYYKYIGSVESIKDVPLSDCLYTIMGGLYIRRIDFNKLAFIKNNKVKEEKDTSDKLDLEPKPDDNTLLIMLKEIMKGFSKNDFKKLFDDDSEMNNMRRAIENGTGQFSWIRFTSMLNKLGLRYVIQVYNKEDLNEEEATSKSFESISGLKDENNG